VFGQTLIKFQFCSVLQFTEELLNTITQLTFVLVLFYIRIVTYFNDHVVILGPLKYVKLKLNNNISYGLSDLAFKLFSIFYLFCSDIKTYNLIIQNFLTDVLIIEFVPWSNTGNKRKTIFVSFLSSS